MKINGILASYTALVTASIAGLACFSAVLAVYLPYSSAKWEAAGVRFPIEFYKDIWLPGVDMEQHSAGLHRADALYQKLIFLDFLANVLPLLLTLLAAVVTIIVLSRSRRKTVSDVHNKKFTPDQILVVVAALLCIFTISFFKICDWKKVAADNQHQFHLRRIANWNKHFENAQHRKWIDPSDSLDPKQRADILNSALQIIENNRHTGQPFWRGLDSRQLLLVLGHEPITLDCRMLKGMMPCYFDRNRNSIIIDRQGSGNPGNSTLAELDPDLQSLVPKFHLKESPYVPNVYGLDSDHDEEHITELSGHPSLNYE